MSATPAEIARRALADHLTARPAAELLSRYARERDPDAFAGLVQQFGPLVLGVCRRALGPSADADDAFQAVFLALARRANSFRDAQALPAWLHRVALRTARKALARRAAEPVALPGTSDPTDPSDPFANAVWKDVRRVLDEELDALPEKVRGPVVLCWFDGLTQDEAAERLGVSLNTLKRRLEVGRTLLRTRLARRGLAPVVVTAAALAPTGLRADVPWALVAIAADAARSAKPLAGGWPQLLAFSTSAVVIACGLAFVSAGNAPTEPAPPPRAALPADRPADDTTAPLPPGAVARFGSMHFRVPDQIHATALSPDGTRVALAGDSAVRLYEAATWRLLQTLPADEGDGTGRRGHTLAFSPDGTRLAYTKNGQFAFAWDLKTGKRTHRFHNGDTWGWSHFCAFTPDGLLALSDKDKLRFFDPATGTEKRAVNAPHALALSPDGKYVVRHAGSVAPVSLVLSDATTGKNLHTFDTTVGWWIATSFSPDGKRLVLLPLHGTEAEVWDVPQRTLVKRLKTPVAGHCATGAGCCAGPAPDGGEVWLQLPDGNVLRWDAISFRELPRFAAGTAPTPSGLLALPDGRTALAPSAWGWVRIYDRSTGAERAIPGRYHLGVFALSPDGEFVAVGDKYGRIDLLDPVTGKLVRTLRAAGAPVYELVFGPDGAVLGVGETGLKDPTRDRTTDTVRALWVSNGKELWSRTSADGQEKDVDRLFPLGFTAEDRMIVSHYPGTVRAWDTRTGKESFRLITNGARPVVSPDGRLLVTDENGEIVLSDLATGRETGRVKNDPEEKRNEGLIAWAGNGKALAATLPEDRVCLLSVPIGKVFSRFALYEGAASDSRKRVWRNGYHSIASLALSPDGKRLLASAWDGHAAVWDTQTGKELAKLESGFRVGGTAFAPDGKSAFTFGSTGLGYRWDVETLIAAQTPKK